MYSPMSASEFINNPVLATALYNRVGKLYFLIERKQTQRRMFL